MTNSAHLYKSVLFTTGSVDLRATVQILEAGTTNPVSAMFYADAALTQLLPNPFTINNGTIDCYFADYRRVKIVVTPVGSPVPYTFDNVDTTGPSGDVTSTAISLFDTAGVEWFLTVSTTGTLVISSAPPNNSGSGSNPSQPSQPGADTYTATYQETY